MDIPDGIMCRFCGKKWFQHSLVSHEKNCRKKITGQVDMLYQQYRLKFLYPAEFTDWPLPPKIDQGSYNAHAFKEYQNTQQPCPRCGRKYPIIAMASHLSECTADPKERPKTNQSQNLSATKQLDSTQVRSGMNKQQMVQQSVGIPQKRVEQPIAAGQGYDDVEGDMPPVPTNKRGKQQVFEIAPQGPDNRIECTRCGRKFNPDRIDAHERICNKVKFDVAKVGEKDDRDEVTKLKERIQQGFDPNRYASMAGDDIGGISGYKRAAPAKGKGLGAQKAGLGGAGTSKAASKARAPPKDEFADRVMDDGRIMCSKCGRGFARDRIDKHESICTSLQNMQTSKVGERELSNKTSQYGIKGATGFVEKTISQPQSATQKQAQAMRPTAQAPQYGAAPSSYQATKGFPSKAPAQASAGYGQKASAIQPARAAVAPQTAGGAAKFCHECGYKYTDTAKFCCECGSKRQ